MLPELGQLCLVMALLVSSLQAAVPLLQRAAGTYRISGLARPVAMLNFMLLAAAFGLLLNAHASDDFSVLNVVLNSHSSKPLLYKITGTWGNHEGSMLLWMLVLGGCGFLVALLPAADRALQSATLSAAGFISAGFLAFILFTSNPFLRVWPIPADGQDLNPILQDIGLAFHPPTLYVGYVGFGIVFAYAVAGMWLGRIDRLWAKQVQPWILFPWSALTLGIGAGAWWAYRELGWGGWWFWDPVENVSLLPWLSGTALLHANLVLMRRGKLARWVALLAILTFSLSLIGTFIVRSGLITSVHAFASDPARGMFILAYIVVVSGGALLLYALSDFEKSAPVQLLSRSGFILIGNLLLLVATFVVLLAILYPVFLQLMHLPGVSVGPGYFNHSFLPIVAPLPLLAALAPLLHWDSARRAQLVAQLKALAPALLVAALLAALLSRTSWLLAACGLGLAAWLIAGALRYLFRQLRADTLGLRMLGGFTAHLGVAVLVLGITLTALLKQTYEAPLVPGQPLQFGRFTLRLLSAEQVPGPNYTARRAEFEISEDGRAITTLAPELRDYPVRQMQTTEAALYSLPWRDLYIALGRTDEKNGIGVRLYVTPGQQLVWGGFVLAALGGLMSMAVQLLAWRKRT